MSQFTNSQFTSEGQLSIQLQLSGLQSQIHDRSTDATTQLQHLRNCIQEKVELALQETYQLARHGSYRDAEGHGCDGTVGTPEQNFSETLRLVQKVKVSLDTLLQNRNGSPPEIRILKRVFFPSLYMRKEGMRPADVNTFEWIFRESVEEPAEGSQEESSEQFKAAARKKATVATQLLQWLRNSNGVFHISGKAGSGKSTMMKLLLDNQRTRQELDHWADGNPLLFAHFFFWSSGDHLQQSLEGLYRSILFEILIQCPQLTRKVFPSAYNAFIRSTAEECIEDLFFTPRAFQDAFKRLIAMPSQSNHRICLLIDGLDEYGGGTDDYSGNDIDDLEHQYLAESLKTWASQDNIKILVSSRPHRAFEETFDNNLRIRLHELTHLDIVSSGRQMFERDNSFQRPEVKACYKRLVEAVAEKSEGVFLWATLAIRDLLNCIKRYDRIESLEKRLAGTPRNFDKLYEKMFKSIDIQDRSKALNLMYLVDATASSGMDYFNLNALSITWLDDLETPEFPATCEIKPYTTKEIEERQSEAECQLDSLTKGLVEVRQTSPSPDRPLFFRKHVEFFHRTVRDFIRQSQNIQKFAIKGSNYTAMETRVRVQLAELFFAGSEDVRQIYLWGALFGYFPYRPALDTILNGYERAFTHHNLKGLVPPPLRGWTINVSKPSGEHIEPVSFLHFLAYHECAGYIQREVVANPDQLSSRGDLSLLLSAAVGLSSATVKVLLDAGATPYDLVPSKSKGNEDLLFTVWHWFCATLLGYGRFSPQNPRLRQILVYFLEAGVNRDCYFLLRPRIVDGSKESEAERPPTHVVTLQSLVRRLNPPNLTQLLELIDKPDTSSEIPSLFDPEDYITLDLGWDWLAFDRFELYAIVCGGKWMYDRSMDVRVY
jgi:hypothetical protein